MPRLLLALLIGALIFHVPTRAANEGDEEVTSNENTHTDDVEHVVGGAAAAAATPVPIANPIPTTAAPFASSPVVSKGNSPTQLSSLIAYTIPYHVM